jgi:Flp pilus assembly protein TadG
MQRRGKVPDRGATVRPGTRPGERGQGLVELAFATPLLLLLLLGTIDLGRMYADYVDLKHAARDGAGYGILKPSDITGMKSRVLAAGVPAGTTATATCTGTCDTVGATGTVEVTATSTFAPVTLGFFSWLGVDGEITLTATAKMRVLS